MHAHPGSDLAFEILDLGVEGSNHRDEAEHEPPTRSKLALTDTSARGTAELGHQRGWMLPARVPLALEKRLHPRDAQTAGVGGARVALQEREQNLRVHVTEQRERSRPEPLELRAELVHDPRARGDEILPR